MTYNYLHRTLCLMALSLALLFVPAMKTLADHHEPSLDERLLDVRFTETRFDAEHPLVVGILEGGVLTPSASAVNEWTGGQLERALATSRFDGERGQLLELIAPSGMTSSHVLLLGLGAPQTLTERSLEDAGGLLAAHLMSTGAPAASVAVDTLTDAALEATEIATALAVGAQLRSYRFDLYDTRTPDTERPQLGELTLMLENPAQAEAHYQTLEPVVAAVFLTRDLVNQPANVIYPEAIADEARNLEALGVEVEVLGVEEMQNLGMGALLGVGQGSTRPPRLVVMQWKGGQDDAPPLAFLGKGVTFDTGGISLKSGTSVPLMKGDMAGAAAVLGAMRALAGRGANVNAVGVIPLVENMPSGTAQRPGDVVTTMSGQTIEIISTDAEGRLILADALWYTQDRFQPRYMIDLATLTGSKVRALGREYAALFSTDDRLADMLVTAGKAVDEKVWQLPLDAAYDRDIASSIADMKNTGESGSAGAIAGAKLLEQFINGTPWAHLDIAGMALIPAPRATVPAGASGFGVRLLDQFVRDHFETTSGTQ